VSRLVRNGQTRRASVDQLGWLARQFLLSWNYVDTFWSSDISGETSLAQLKRGINDDKAGRALDLGKDHVFRKRRGSWNEAQTIGTRAEKSGISEVFSAFRRVEFKTDEAARLTWGQISLRNPRFLFPFPRAGHLLLALMSRTRVFSFRILIPETQKAIIIESIPRRFLSQAGNRRSYRHTKAH